MKGLIAAAASWGAPASKEARATRARAMPSSRDNRPKRSHATIDGPLVGTLGDLYPTLLVRLWCRPCRHTVEIPAPELAELLGPELGLDALRRRARCTACGVRNAGLHVVAEGVEDEETLEALRVRHCDVVQGHLFAKAMDLGDFSRWLSDGTDPTLRRAV